MKKFWKNKDPNHFIRFGSLNLKKQKGFGKDSFHAPPTRYGFYAMVFFLQELFLVSSLDKTQPEIFKKDKSKSFDDEDYFNSLSDKDIDKYWQKKDLICVQNNKIKSLIRREFIKKDGNIWHHLSDNIKGVKVLAQHGSWIKTSMKDYAKILNRNLMIERCSHIDKKSKSINEIKGPNGWISKDHYEVFIDEKI